MKKYIISIAVLICVLAVLITFRVMISDDFKFEIVYKDRSIQLANFDQFRTFPITTEGKWTFSAVFIPDILDEYGIDKKGIENLSFYSRDGGSIRIPVDEIENIYISTLDDQSIRLIMSEDNFHQRWLKNLTKLELEPCSP